MRFRNAGDEFDREWNETRTVAASCSFCDWAMVGPLRTTRAAFTAHRKREHPFVRETMPNPRSRAVTPEMRQAA